MDGHGHKLFYYDYNTAKGLLKSTTDPKGNITSYTYDPNTDQLLTTSGTPYSGATSTTTFGYTNYMLSSVTRNGTAYSYAYDQLSRVTSAKVGTQSLVTNTYNTEGNLALKRATYGNGQYYEPVYDSLDRVTESKYNGASKYKYAYNDKNQLSRIEDLESNITWAPVYDLSGRLIRQTGSNNTEFALGYDDSGSVASLAFTKNNSTASKTTYSYNKPSGLVDEIKLDSMGGGTVKYSYDAMNRVTQTYHTTKSSYYPKFRAGYTYAGGAGGSKTGLVSEINYSKRTFLGIEDYGTLSYTYNANGNIATISVSINGSNYPFMNYAYDGLNQLTREDNEWINKSYVYAYNTDGNITSKKEYAYTTGTLGTATKTVSYAYGDANWKDKLTNFNGKAITYDQIGNPLTYDGYAYTWQKGRQLKSVAGNGKNLSFAYNQDGRRTKKVSGSATTAYDWCGGLLMRQSGGGVTLNFSYDANGRAIGFKYNGNSYYYMYNLQGDVVSLYNSTADIVCNYVYDAWGNIVEIRDGDWNIVTSSSHITNINPIVRFFG